MKKLVLSGAAIAALMVGPASAADIAVRPVYRAQQTASLTPFPTLQRGPVGVAGARWGDRCWVDIDSTRYAGYWAPCPRPVAAARPVRTAVRRGVVPIVARF
jgi:hypothetical protein